MERVANMFVGAMRAALQCVQLCTFLSWGRARSCSWVQDGLIVVMVKHKVIVGNGWCLTGLLVMGQDGLIVVNG